MKGVKIWFFAVVLIFAATSFYSFTGEIKDLTPGNKPKRYFIIENTDLVTDNNSNAYTLVQIGDVPHVEYMRVLKSSDPDFQLDILGENLTPEYTFTYQALVSDPESFELTLNLTYTSGAQSKSITLSIDNPIQVKEKLEVKSVTRIARVTGKTRAGENLPNPNNTDQEWDVGGTDLGIFWEMTPGRYGVFFGDTFGKDFVPRPSNPGPNGSNWRSNVLAFTENTDLDERGVVFESMVTDQNGNAKELIPGGHQAPGGDVTSIPTTIIRINGTDYAHYFNVKNWGTNPMTTNHSGIYKSTDDGQNWTKVNSIHFPANSRFALAAYFKKDGYVYMIGTPAYRNKPAYLARFKEDDIENQNEYEYWNSNQSKWIKGDENQSTVLVSGTVGEMSLIYNKTYGKWIIAYFNSQEYNITMRVADDITGPWIKKSILAKGSQYPQLYGSYFHPKSEKGDFLYFTMSLWEPYNVFLMKVELSDE